MRHLKLLLITVIVCFCSLANAQQPAVLLMRGDRLASVKSGYRTGEPTAKALVTFVVNAADKYLGEKPVSVMDKTITPPSGDKHDYMSQAPYFWYDSSKPNGLPYLRRDGQRNPEINKLTDRTNLGKLDDATRMLALAWYFTNKEAYASKATTLLKAWFIDPATKMNPHLEFGQGIPGINTGRGIGIIETVALTSIADNALLIKGSNAWSAANEQQLKEWYGKYLNWMLNSKYGKDEHAAKNNHGTYWYVQAVDFSLFTGQTTQAKTLLEESKTRLDSQINAEGKMQLELDRTNGLGYSTFNIQAWFRLARLGEHLKIDLWNYRNPSGAGMRTALDWLAPYALAEKKWPYEQITDYNEAAMHALLLQASKAYKEESYREKAVKLDPEKQQTLNTLLYGN